MLGISAISDDIAGLLPLKFPLLEMFLPDISLTHLLSIQVSERLSLRCMWNSNLHHGPACKLTYWKTKYSVRRALLWYVVLVAGKFVVSKTPWNQSITGSIDISAKSQTYVMRLWNRNVWTRDWTGWASETQRTHRTPLQQRGSKRKRRMVISNK